MQVAAVAFNGEPMTPDTKDCYKDILSKATTRNINNMKDFINLWETNGIANYEKAFTTAFSFFNKSENSLRTETRGQLYYVCFIKAWF